MSPALAAQSRVMRVRAPCPASPVPALVLSPEHLLPLHHSSPDRCVLATLLPVAPPPVSCLLTDGQLPSPTFWASQSGATWGPSRAGIFSTLVAGQGRARQLTPAWAVLHPRSWAGGTGGAPVSHLAPSDCWAASGTGPGLTKRRM